jgi:hypothetical protein
LPTPHHKCGEAVLTHSQTVLTTGQNCHSWSQLQLNIVPWEGTLVFFSTTPSAVFNQFCNSLLDSTTVIWVHTRCQVLLNTEVNKMTYPQGVFNLLSRDQCQNTNGIWMLWGIAPGECKPICLCSWNYNGKQPSSHNSLLIQMRSREENSFPAQCSLPYLSCAMSKSKEGSFTMKSEVTLHLEEDFRTYKCVQKSFPWRQTCFVQHLSSWHNYFLRLSFTCQRVLSGNRVMWFKVHINQIIYLRFYFMYY